MSASCGGSAFEVSPGDAGPLQPDSLPAIGVSDATSAETSAPDGPSEASVPSAKQGLPSADGGIEPDALGDASADTAPAPPGEDAEAAAAHDAAGPRDAAVPLDAEVPRDVTLPVSFCASLSPRPQFCDDFDSERALPGVWSQINQSGGHLGLKTTDFVSAPASLEAQFDALQPPSVLNTALRTTFAMPPAPVTIVWAFALRVAASDSTPNAAAVVGALDSFDAAGNRYSTQLTVYSEMDGSLRLRFEEQSGFVGGTSAYVAHDLPDPLPSGTWKDLRVVLQYDSARVASARVTLGGVEELSTALSPRVTAATLQLTIGSSFETTPSLGWTLRYDNVTLDF